MSTQAFSFYGGHVKLGNDDAVPLASPPVAETFTEIAEVQQCHFSGSKVDIVDVTNIQSPNRRREYIATLIDSGEFTFDANFIPGDTSQSQMQTVMDSAERRNWEVILPASLGQFDFAGLITSIDRDLQFDKEAKLKVKVKITGPVDFTA